MLGQLGDFPANAFDELIAVMAALIEYPDDPMRTFPADDPYVRRAEFGGAGLVTYVINDARQAVTLIDVTWTGRVRSACDADHDAIVVSALPGASSPRVACRSAPGSRPRSSCNMTLDQFRGEPGATGNWPRRQEVADQLANALLRGSADQGGLDGAPGPNGTVTATSPDRTNVLRSHSPPAKAA